MIRMVDEVRVQVDDLRRQLADAEAHAAKASTVRLDLVEVVREADILIDWLTGAGLPLEIAGPVLDVQQVLAAADALAASMDLGRARVKLKSMLREIVARIDVDLYEEKFTIYLRDGQTIRGTVYEVPGDPILRVLDPVGVDKGEYAGWVRLKVAE